MKILLLTATLLLSSTSFADTQDQCIAEYLNRFGFGDVTKLTSQAYNNSVVSIARYYCDPDAKAEVRQISNGTCRARNISSVLVCWMYFHQEDCDARALCYWDY